MTVQTKSNTNWKSLLVGTLAVATSYSIGYMASTIEWRNELLKKGYAEYNNKTGKWHLAEPDIVLMNIYDPEIRSTSKGVTIKEYLTKADLEIKSLRQKLEETDAVVKDQEKTLFTYEKKLGIVRKVPEVSSQPIVKVN